MRLYKCTLCGHEDTFDCAENGRYFMYRPCESCNVTLGMKIVKEDMPTILRCGSKDKLSKWEEIKMRPRSGDV